MGWRPEWGGILNCQDPDDGEWYAFPPVFNRLIMMDVTNPVNNINHFVSEVISGSPVNLVTYTGWWAESDNSNTLNISDTLSADYGGDTDDLKYSGEFTVNNSIDDSD